MTQKKIEEARKWWNEIKKMGVNNQPIDAVDFADRAFIYVPILLEEISRLKEKEKK